MWLIGKVNKRDTVCSACELCYVIRNKYTRVSFFAIFDSLVVLAACSDAEILKPGKFCANTMEISITLPLADVHVCVG